MLNFLKLAQEILTLYNLTHLCTNFVLVLKEYNNDDDHMPYLIVHVAPTVVVGNIGLTLHQAVQQGVVLVEQQALLTLNIMPYVSTLYRVTLSPSYCPIHFLRHLHF